MPDKHRWCRLDSQGVTSEAQYGILIGNASGYHSADAIVAAHNAAVEDIQDRVKLLLRALDLHDRHAPTERGPYWASVRREAEETAHEIGCAMDWETAETRT